MFSGISRDSWTLVFSEPQLPPFKEEGSGSRLSARVPLNAAVSPYTRVESEHFCF